ncbi:MAG: GGDEF domain-containing protein [Chloroflexi bacterium]|nr:GGDEF domain-containing protein [Chloroflexota bacterium]
MPIQVDHHQSLFEHAPISLWEQDYSGIKHYFQGLRNQGVGDLSAYFNQHPDGIDACMRLIKVKHVNTRTLTMFGAGSETELLNNLDRIFRDEMRGHFLAELLALWNNETSWSGEGINYTLQDEPLNIRLHWQILPECLETWECVMVAIEDITLLKKAEDRFQNLFTHAPISLWEENYRGIAELFDQLRSRGITDLRHHLLEHPELVDQFMSRIAVTDVNLKTLELYGSQTKGELLSNLGKVFRDEMRGHFTAELLDMWNGKTSYEHEGINYSLSGEPFNIHLDWRLMPGHEKDFSWVMVAIQDITARKKSEEYLRYLGTHDVMTGLYNRAYFEEEVGKLAESKDQISFILADLDGLKRVNDSMGHQAGDNLIRRAAEVLKAVFNQGEIAARIGGDEFIAILENQDPQEFIERIQSFIILNNKYYQGSELRLALGSATRLKNEGLEKTFTRADEAMYLDKEKHYADNPESSLNRRKGGK